MKTRPIGDTGMVLPGAPKDRAKKILGEFDVDTLNTNLADTLDVDPDDLVSVKYDESDQFNHLTLEEWQSNLTKAKIWPSPDYSAMVESGIPYPAVKALKRIHDNMPTKCAMPTPTKISGFASIMAEGAELEREFRREWQPLVDHLASEPPSFRRIASHWRAGIQLCGADDEKEAMNETALLPAVTDDDTWEFLKNSLHQTERMIGEFSSTAARLDFHMQSYYGVSLPSHIFKSASKLRDSSANIDRDTGLASSGALLNSFPINGYLTLKRMTRGVENSGMEVSDMTDDQIGYFTSSIFSHKLLGKKPRQLSANPRLHPSDEPEAENSATQEPKEPKKLRRPIRLNEAETKELLDQVDTDDLQKNPEYQSFSPLVDAGIVRGAQIGNWVTQKERPALVRRNHNAITTLTRVAGITPSHFGLGNPIPSGESEGEVVDDAYDGSQALGLAFGARGKSNAAAHFEPSQFIINLTRKKGAGSLAHEWTHALDFRLGSLLDKRGINSDYHPKDIKRVTGAKRLEYFSEYMAVFWQIETLQNRNGSIDFKNQQQKADAHILRGLRDDLPLDVRKEVMPLLQGVSNMMREAYCRPSTSKEIMDAAVQKMARSTRFSNADEIEDGKRIREEFEVLQKYVPHDNPDLLAWREDFNNLRPGNLMADPMDDWSYLSYHIPYMYLGEDVGNGMANDLEKLLDRDIPQNIKDDIATAVEASHNMGRLFHVMEASAQWHLMNTNMPPRPEPDDADLDPAERRQRNSDRFAARGAAVTEMCRHVTDPVLDRFIELAEEQQKHYERALMALNDLPPTEMGKDAGLGNINAFAQEDVNNWARDFRRMGQSFYITDTTPWEVFRDYRRYNNEMSAPAERETTRIQPGIGKDLVNVHKTLTANLDDYIHDGGQVEPTPEHIEFAYFKVDKGFDAEQPNRRETSSDEIWERLLNEDSPEVFQRMEKAGSDYAMGCFTMLAQAHMRSEHNDGTLASLTKTLADPGRLSPMPQGVTTYLRDLHSRNMSLRHKYPDSDNDDSSIMANISHEISLEIPRILPFRLASNLDRDPERLNKNHIDQGTWGFVAQSMQRAIQDGDMSGLEALDDSMAKGHLISMRYASDDDNRRMFSQFMPASWQEAAYEALSPDNFRAQMQEKPKINIEKMSQDSEKFRYAMANLRQASQKTAARSAPTVAAKREIERKQDATKAMSFRGGEVYPPVKISNLVMESTHYAGGSIARDGRTNGKGGYWNQTREVMARMFEKVYHEALEREGTPDPFLVTVPSNDAQEDALSRVELPTGGYANGNEHTLLYPAADELNSMVDCFQTEVAPNMERALSALYPASAPHYEAYRKGLEEAQQSPDNAPDNDKVTREDVDPNDDRLMAQNQESAPATEPDAGEPAPDAETPDKAPDESDQEPEKSPGTTPSPTMGG